MFNQTLSILTSLTREKVPGPLPLFRTASDGKLGGAWERGYVMTMYYVLETTTNGQQLAI